MLRYIFLYILMVIFVFAFEVIAKYLNDGESNYYHGVLVGIAVVYAIQVLISRRGGSY